MIINKFTPILIVDSIEDCLSFWETQLKYEVTVKVPHEDKLGFVILKQGDSEVMLQTKASIAADLPAVVQKISGKSVALYADVSSLSEVEKSLKNVEVVVPRRKTFYGAHEIWVKDPSGNIIGFAEIAKE